MVFFLVSLFLLPTHEPVISKDQWPHIVSQLTVDLPKLTDVASESQPRVLVHGFEDATQGSLSLGPLTTALRQHLSGSQHWQLVHPAAAAILDAERGDQPADHLDLDAMRWYARQVGADYVLSGRVAFAGTGAAFALMPGEQRVLKIILRLVDSRSGKEVARAQQMVDLANSAHQASGAR